MIDLKWDYKSRTEEKGALFPFHFVKRRAYNQ